MKAPQLPASRLGSLHAKEVGSFDPYDRPNHRNRRGQYKPELVAPEYQETGGHMVQGGGRRGRDDEIVTRGRHVPAVSETSSRCWAPVNQSY